MKIKKSGKGIVDISLKQETLRRAVATGEIHFDRKAFALLMKQGSPKGDVIEIAKVAGLMASKQTPSILPLCHPINLEKVAVTITPNKTKYYLTITVEVCCHGKTGVEMEALTAVSVAALCVYDMMKWAGQGMVIKNIQLQTKTGGKSGDYQR